MKKKTTDKNITVRLTKTQLTALDRLAIQLYSDRSKLIRRYIDEGIKREKKKRE